MADTSPHRGKTSAVVSKPVRFKLGAVAVVCE